MSQTSSRERAESCFSIRACSLLGDEPLSVCHGGWKTGLPDWSDMGGVRKSTTAVTNPLCSLLFLLHINGEGNELPEANSCITRSDMRQKPERLDDNLK